MKLFIQQYDDKFINNMSLIESKNLVVNDNISGNLYQIHYKYAFDSYLFVSSLMTNEIYQYILEFHESKKLILYHDTINTDIVNALGQYCINIGNQSDSNRIIKIPPLINSHIFYNRNVERNKHIPCFVDKASMLDTNLFSVLYPNTKFNIRIFSSSLMMNHQQNVGWLSEQDRADVLNESENCLLIDDLYLAEALSCGTKILRPENGQLIEDVSVSLPSIETYDQFLDRILK